MSEYYLDAYWECWHLFGRHDVGPAGHAVLRRIRRHLRAWIEAEE